MIILPEEIETRLGTGEIVDARFELGNCCVFTSDKRIFVKRGQEVRDIDYTNVSRLTLSREIRSLVIAFGLLICIGGHVFIEYWPWGLWLVGCGLAMVAAGLIVKKCQLLLTINSRSSRERFLGNQIQLHLLLKVLRFKISCTRGLG